MQPEGLRGDVLDGMGFVQDDEVVRKEEVAVVWSDFFGGGEQGKKERMIQYDHICFGHASADVLIKAATAGMATPWRAGVGFAANEGPHF